VQQGNSLCKKGYFRFRDVAEIVSLFLSQKGACALNRNADTYFSLSRGYIFSPLNMLPSRPVRRNNNNNIVPGKGKSTRGAHEGKNSIMFSVRPSADKNTQLEANRTFSRSNGRNENKITPRTNVEFHLSAPQLSHYCAPKGYCDRQ